MLHAVSFALLDSVNALLIGILVAIGIILPRGKYRRIAALVVVGEGRGARCSGRGHVFSAWSKRSN